MCPTTTTPTPPPLPTLLPSPSLISLAKWMKQIILSCIPSHTGPAGGFPLLAQLHIFPVNSWLVFKIQAEASPTTFNPLSLHSPFTLGTAPPDSTHRPNYGCFTSNIPSSCCLLSVPALATFSQVGFNFSSRKWLSYHHHPPCPSPIPISFLVWGSPPKTQCHSTAPAHAFFFFLV